MSRPIVMAHSDAPVLTTTTPVEVIATGELELQPDAPPRVVTTAGALVDQATQGFRDTVFDPKQEAAFTRHRTTLDALSDQRLGVSDTMPEVSQPPSADKVGPAAAVVVKHKALLQEQSPVAYGQVPWSSFEDDLALHQRVTEEKQRLEGRTRNLTILQAHLRQRLYAGMQAVYKTSESTFSAHRGLETAFGPVLDLFTAAAAQGVETKRGLQRAVAKALKNSPPAPAAPAAGLDARLTRTTAKDSPQK